MPSSLELKHIFVQGKKVVQWFSRTMSVFAGGDHLQRTAAKPRYEAVAKAKVMEIKNLSSTVKLLKLRVPDKQFSFKAGQWVDMFIPGVDTVGGFSMSSPPYLLTESGLLHLAVKFSKHPPALWVHTECQVNSEVRLRVGGDFYYAPAPETKPRDLLLLAGGVGVNPLYSMLQHFVWCQKNTTTESPALGKRSAHMLYSAQSESELIFKDELLNIAQTTKNVKLNLFCSRENVTETDSISNGRIQDHDVHSALSGLDVKNTDVFLCGPLPFIEAMKSHCSTASVPQDSIHYERWW